VGKIVPETQAGLWLAQNGGMRTQPTPETSIQILILPWYLHVGASKTRFSLNSWPHTATQLSQLLATITTTQNKTI